MDSTEMNFTSQTADIVSAYVASNALSSDKLADFINSVYGALSRASVQCGEPQKVELKPAISIKKSVTPDFIICLEDGKKFKSLKRQLRSQYDMSPEEYREKWGCRMTIRWLHRPMPLHVLIWPKTWGWAGAAPR